MRWTDAHICDVLVIGAGLAGERVAMKPPWRATR
jgi:succinate dehydrogenase/fumarate reductase flavoprotein subunit